MNFEDLQKAWQGQGSTGRVSIEGDALLKLVRRNQKAFESTIFWRDMREVAIALVLVPVWVFMGLRSSLPWTWYLVIPGLLWVAFFLLRDRRKQRRHEPQPGDPIRDSVVHSLAQVRHQVGLLKNIFWWYLLPIIVPIVVFTLDSSLGRGEPWFLVQNLTLFTLVFWGVYELNQYAVRKDLLPRCEELEEFLQSIDQEENGANESE